MANYTECGKTNEFTVTDETKYQELFSRLSGEGLEDDTVERAGVIYHSFSVIGDNGVSYKSIDENGNEDYLGMVDFMRDLSEILPEGIAASYTETGHERLIQGAFAVIAAKNKPVKVIDLIDLVYQAETEMSNPVRLEIDTSKHDKQTMGLYNKVFAIYKDSVENNELPPLSQELSEKMYLAIDEFEDPVEADPDYYTSQKIYDEVDWASRFREILDDSIKELSNNYTVYLHDEDNNFNKVVLEDGTVMSFEDIGKIAETSNTIDTVRNIKTILEDTDYSIEDLSDKVSAKLINRCSSEAFDRATEVEWNAYTDVISQELPKMIKSSQKVKDTPEKE